jgi:hypothetical protein
MRFLRLAAATTYTTCYDYDTTRCQSHTGAHTSWRISISSHSIKIINDIVITTLQRAADGTNERR